jgi:drug/metabolite transporter (DMT)-like permease
VFYNLSLKQKTEVSVAVPVTYTSAFWGLCTVYIAYHEAINATKFFVVCLFFVALYLIDTKANIKQLKLSKGIVYALIASFIWGTSFALFPVFIKDTGVGVFSLILETTVCLCSVSIVFMVNENNKLVTISLNQFMQILPIALLGFMGVLFFNISTQYLKMSTIVLLDILKPIITVIFSALLLKEKLILQQYVAIVLIIIALVVINYNFILK